MFLYSLPEVPVIHSSPNDEFRIKSRFVYIRFIITTSIFAKDFHVEINL